MTNIHYIAIKEAYGEGKAERSGVPFIQHIDEGVRILDLIGATQEAKNAFMLHPIYQMFDDPRMVAVRKRYGHLFDPYAVELAEEYARVANSYLRKLHYRSPDDAVSLSTYSEVNDMLVADKVQNRKDFEEWFVPYARYAAAYDMTVMSDICDLDQYFKNWLKALNVSEIEYMALISKI